MRRADASGLAGLAALDPCPEETKTRAEKRADHGGDLVDRSTHTERTPTIESNWSKLVFLSKLRGLLQPSILPALLRQASLGFGFPPTHGISMYGG